MLPAIILIFHIYIIIVNKKKDTSFTLFKILKIPLWLDAEMSQEKSMNTTNKSTTNTSGSTNGGMTAGGFWSPDPDICNSCADMHNCADSPICPFNNKKDDD